MPTDVPDSAATAGMPVQRAGGADDALVRRAVVHVFCAEVVFPWRRAQLALAKAVDGA